MRREIQMKQGKHRAGQKLPEVRMITELGDVRIQLDDQRAPRSAGAFLEVVRSGAYDGGKFGRVVRLDNDRGHPSIEAIQAGVADTVTPLANIEIEPTGLTGLRHEDGAISLPRIDGGAGSAHGFFLCIGAQPALDQGGGRALDGLGFAAFGRVTEGMDVVRRIHGVDTSDEAPDEYVRGQIPVRPVRIHSIRQEPNDAAELVAALAEDYWQFRVREFPIEAALAGECGASSRLDEGTAAAHVRRAGMCRTMLGRAQAIEIDCLGDEDVSTLVLLKEQLGLIIELETHEEYRRPRLFPHGLANFPMMVVQQASLTSVADREALIARLEIMPDALRDRIQELTHGLEKGYMIPRPLLARVLDVIDSELADDGLEASVGRRFADPVPGASVNVLDEQRLRALALVGERITPVIAKFREMIAALVDAQVTDHVGLHAQPGGRAYYEVKVRQQTSTDLDPDAIHTLGLTEVARIRAALDELLARLGRAGELAEVAAELKARVAGDADALLTLTRALAKKVDGLLPRYFGHMPRVTYAVEQMTRSASVSMPPAYAQPAPADRTMPGIFWLTAISDRLPLHMLPALTLHEAWPGHLMQIAIANELSSLPAFRRFGMDDYNGYIEGWALYCERLGYDLGLYAEPTDEFGFLVSDLWRAARLVIDTGLHWKGWSREESIAYLKDTSLLPTPTCEAEVDRYIGMPAQALSYKLGELVISGLRKEAEDCLGGRFRLSEFHDSLLALGPLPLTELQRRMQIWLTRKAETLGPDQSFQLADQLD